MPTVPSLRVGGRTLDLGRNLVMGIVNANADSFSDAGLDDRLALAARLVADGADILDIGGQSATTLVPETEAADELALVVPLIAEVAARFPDLVISVDTYKPAVAEAAVAAGASMINDVSGLRDPALATIAAESGGALVLMHTRVAPKQRLQDPGRYADVGADVVAFLRDAMERATARGLDPESLVVDPGPDFAKTPHQTLRVLRSLDRVRDLGRPLLLALSRKDVLGALLDRAPRGRDAGTLAAVALTAGPPGSIYRVHDVAATRDVLRVVDALVGRSDIPPDYVLPERLRRASPS